MPVGVSNIADISAKLFRFWNGDAASAGDVLESAGAGKPPAFATPTAPTNVPLLDKFGPNPPNNVINTTVETTHYSFTVPANELTAAGDSLRLTYEGNIFQNSGGPVNYDYRVELAGLLVVDFNAFSPVASSGLSLFWQGQTIITRLTSTLAIGYSRFFLQTGSAGTGDDTTVSSFAAHRNNFAFDFSIDRLLAFTVQMSVANASAQSQFKAALLESLK